MTYDPALPPGFQARRVEVDGVGIHLVCGGDPRAQALLLLHGHPQTHAIWHLVAPRLAERFFVVAADLRGYGDSDKVLGPLDHSAHSKRAMAHDQVGVMRALGHARFLLCAHDRGARVGHRLCLDHPEAVEKAVLLDIAPTLAMYEQTTMAFARAYWHWFFLIQPEPLPERMIGADPAFYVRQVMSRGSKGLDVFAPEALAEYLRCAGLPGTIHAFCEDYRAGRHPRPGSGPPGPGPGAARGLPSPRILGRRGRGRAVLRPPGHLAPVRGGRGWPGAALRALRPRRGAGAAPREVEHFLLGP